MSNEPCGTAMLRLRPSPRIEPAACSNSYKYRIGTPCAERHPTGACSETASASRLGLRLGRSIRNSCQGIAQLLGTSGQMFELPLSALAFVLVPTLLTVGLMCLEEVIHCSSNFV